MTEFIERFLCKISAIIFRNNVNIIVKNAVLKIIFATFIFLFVSGGAAENVNSQKVSPKIWNPQKTWVFFVGLLEWQDKKTFASFPKKNRRDRMLFNLLKERGVPENQMFFLEDKEATTAKIKSSLQHFLTRAKPDDWIFFYYSGHGYKSDDNLQTFLAGYDASRRNVLNVNEIPDTIDKYFKGANAVIMLDNCFSGAMAEAVKSRKSNVSYAVFASSHFNSFSTGNWTFTESLIYAFRGESFIDDDANGLIDFRELAENSADDMLFAEEQIAQFAFTGSLNNQIIIAQNVPKAAPRVGERIEAFDSSEWFRGIITGVENNRYKVHYFGYEYEEDNFRTANQIRQFKPKSYPVGAKIRAESDGKWYAAKVLDVKGGAHLVSYIGYGAEWNEWISSDRIRRLNTAKIPQKR